MLYSSKFRCGIMPLCLFCALSMVFLSLSRIGLMLWLNSNVPDGSVLYILLQGLRVDFASVCGLYGPAFLILIFCSIVRLKNNAVILIIKIYLALGFTFLVFNEAATPPFILEYGVRPNHLYVQYLIYPKEVLNTLWNGHKLAVFADIFIIALSLYAGFKLASLLFKNYVFASFKITLLSFIAVIIILPLGVRSTLGHRPLNPALISFCNDPLANSLPLNSSYSAVYALAHLNQGKLSASDIYSFDNKENILFEGMDFSVKKNTAHPTSKCPLNQIITSNSPQKYNVVIVLEESLGADFVKSLGGLPLTPNLEQLKNEGWWFTNLYAAGHRSIRGIEAVTASFPPSPLDSIVKLPRTESSYATLSRIYESYGYKTSFIYGGESHFDNMRNYFLENGMQEVIDQNDYKNPKFVASWGVSDEDLFLKAHEKFTQLKQNSENFFSVIFTSSFHDPFEIPEGKVKLPASIQTDEPRRLAAAMYADYALGKFFKWVEKSNYKDDTIFLVIADHESRVRGNGSFPLSEFSIPALILGPNIKAYQDERVVSQIDMAPTLLSLSGISGEFPLIGQNLNQEHIKERALMQFNQIFGYLENGKFVTLEPQGKAAFFNVGKHNSLVETKEDKQLLKKAVALENLGPLIYSQGYMLDSCINP